MLCRTSSNIVRTWPAPTRTSSSDVSEDSCNAVTHMNSPSPVASVSDVANIAEQETCLPPERKCLRKGMKPRNAIDVALWEIGDLVETVCKASDVLEGENENTLFGKYLVTQLQKLPEAQAAMLRFKMMELVMQEATSFQ